MKVTKQIQQFLKTNETDEILVSVDDYLSLMEENDYPIGIKMPMVIKIEECEIRATEDTKRCTDLNSEKDEDSLRADGDDGEEFLENNSILHNPPFTIEDGYLA